MSNRTKSILKTYGITSIIAFSVAIYYVFSRNFFSLSTLDKYRVICDGFTIPALILISFSILILISNTGFFDGVIYGVKLGLKMLVPGRFYKNPENYADYKERRKDKKVKGFWYLLHVGLFFLLIAFIFLFLFNTLDYQ